MNRNIINTFIAIGILLSWNNSFGQQPSGTLASNCPRERIMVHLSHESVFTGEICWFKIYCTSSLSPMNEISDLAFIELVGMDNTSIIRKKILLTRGEGTGEFEIPDNLPTGLYYIIAYTNWMKNFGEGSFFRKGFAIINPDQPYHNNSDSVLTIHEPADSVPDYQKDHMPRVIPDKKSYSKREKVTVGIKTGGIPGNAPAGDFSVSVYRKEPQMIFSSCNKPELDFRTDPDIINFKPDHKGIWLSGKLADRSGNPVPAENVILSMPGPGTDISNSITDTGGNFQFLLKPEEGDQEVVFEIPDKDLKIDLGEPFWNGFRNFPDNLLFMLDRGSFSYLKDRYACFQIQEKFKKHNFTRSDPSRYPADSGVFYSKPYQTIEMDNFISLDSLTEYFYELVPSVKFIRKRGEFEISVIDPQTAAYIEDKPGVFFDGVKYDNYAAIAAIPAGEIRRMAILPTTYFYKDFTFGGIIDIHTKKSDFNGIKALPDMIRFRFPMANASEWKFVSPDYAVDDAMDRIPDFRYLLHWDTEVKVGSSGETDFSFYTGDVTGRFVIRVVGISEKGEILQAENEIEVLN